MNAIENWIEETINALDNIQRADVPLSLRVSLMNNVKSKEIRLNGIQKWTIAASILVLLGINLISVTQYAKFNKLTSSTKDEKNLVYKEYFSSDY